MLGFHVAALTRISWHSKAVKRQFVDYNHPQSGAYRTYRALYGFTHLPLNRKWKVHCLYRLARISMELSIQFLTGLGTRKSQLSRGLGTQRINAPREEG